MASRTLSDLRRYASHLHIGCLAVALVLLPMGGLTDTWGLILLGLAAVMALPECISRWRFLAARPTLLLWLAWWALAFVSITWSTDPSQAMQQGGWGLLAVPAMVPVIDRPRWWILPLAVGVAAQAVIQVLGWHGLVEDSPYPPSVATGGLYSYLPLVGLWAATSMVLLCPLLVSLRTSVWRAIVLLLIVAAAISLLLTMNRTSWIIAGIGLILIAIRSIRFLPRIKRQWPWIGCILIVLAATLVAAFTQFDFSKRAAHTHRDVESFTTTDLSPQDVGRFDSSIGRRVLWWHAGWELLGDRPFIGHGAGSIARSLATKEAEMPSQWGAGVTDFITSNPHASLVATAIEQGGLGVLLLLAIAIGVAIGAWRRGRTCAALIGLGPAWIGLLLFSLTHAVLLEPYTSVLVSILLVAALPGKEDPAKVHPAQ